MAERIKRFSRNKEEVITAFLKECGENAEWEDWLNFLQERAKFEEFEWIRTLESKFPLLKKVRKKTDTSLPKDPDKP
jgi:hypothetical protein